MKRQVTAIFILGLLFAFQAVPASAACGSQPKPYVDYSGCNFFEMTFGKSNPTQVVDLTGANFEGANLTGAKFLLVNLTGASFRNASMIDAHFSTVATLTNADFSGALLNQSSLQSKNLSGAKFVDSSLKNVVIGDLLGETVNAQNTDFTRANLEGSAIQDVDFTGANFRDAYGMDSFYRRVATWPTECTGTGSLSGGGSITCTYTPVPPDNGVVPIPAPINIRATGGKSTATITWGLALSPPANLMGYLVKFRGGSQFCDESPCVISGLSNGWSYQFTVTTLTFDGQSKPSASSNAITPAGKPSGPQTLTAKSTKAGASTLKWAGAKSNGSVITEYEISWKLSTAKTFGAWKSVGTKTSYGVTRWKKSKLYHVRIRVTNALGKTTSKVFTVKQTK